jgi:hypothetical protein
MFNSFLKKVIIASSVLLCIGCITGITLLYIFGKQIIRYSQITCTISSMGESSIPVSGAVTLWSVILGAIYIFLGFSFIKVFNEDGKYARNASLLIIIYGLGENIASGLIKA